MRTRRERMVFVSALVTFCVAALPSCSPSHLLGPARQPVGVIPALSLAGIESSGCMLPRNPRRWGHGFEVADPVGMEIESARIARSIEVGGVGHPIVHYLGCRSFVIEIAVLLDEASPDTAGDIGRAAELLSVFLSGAPPRGALWALADSLRLSRDEPFVYGRSMSLSEEESISVRFDPTRSGARLMVVYRLGL
jgi:hypothetical protein